MSKERISKTMKILTIVYMSLVFIGVLLPDAFVLTLDPEELSVAYVPQALIRWFQYVSFLVLPVIAYFNKDVFKKIAIYFCLPVAIIYLCFFNQLLDYHVSPQGTGIYDIRYLAQGIKDFMINPVFRGGLIIGSTLIEIGVIALMFIKESEYFKKFDLLKFDAKKVGVFFLVLACLIASIVPIYVPQHLIGHTNIIFKSFSLSHLAWFVVLVGEIIILTKIFRKRSYEDKYILLLMLALSLFVQYNQLFSRLGELTCKRMPFQLCNIAAYLCLIMLVTKNEKLYHFSLIVNVAGGLIALIVMDTEGTGIGSPANIHYIAEHHNVMAVPILCLLLGLFKPLKKQDIKDFVFGFTFYWSFVLVLGTILNGVYAITGSDYFRVNYLFMFQKEDTGKIVPFLKNWFDVKLSIGDFALYPLIQLLVYFGLMGLCFAIFFIILKLANKNTKQISKSVLEENK